MTAWLDIANEYVGLKEIPGKKHNPTIVGFFAEAGHPQVKDDETAWCAAFVGACLKRAGYPNTGSLAARSYLKYGMAIDKPRKGCIVVLSRGNSTWEGHVGFFVKQTGDRVYLLGGNQSNAVNIAPFPKSKVLGYRWPVEPTRKALKEAGSTEIKTADLVEKASAATAVVAGAAEVADQTGILDTPPPPPIPDPSPLDSIKDVSNHVDTLTSLLQGVQSLAKLVASNVGIAAVVLLLAFAFLARWYIRQRLAAHAAGHPLSNQG